MSVLAGTAFAMRIRQQSRVRCKASKTGSILSCIWGVTCLLSACTSRPALGLTCAIYASRIAMNSSYLLLSGSPHVKHRIASNCAIILEVCDYIHTWINFENEKIHFFPLSCVYSAWNSHFTPSFTSASSSSLRASSSFTTLAICFASSE